MLTIGFLFQLVGSLGGSVTLTCDVTFDPRLAPETEVTWRRNGTEVDLAEVGKYRLTGDNGLLIQDLESGDEGAYSCEVRTPLEVVSSPEVDLGVTGEAPRIVSDLGRTTVYEGERLELKCVARGVPRPEVRWMLDGKEVKTM